MSKFAKTCFAGAGASFLFAALLLATGFTAWGVGFLFISIFWVAWAFIYRNRW